MLIDIELKKNAYTPEAFAYQDYLITHGHSVHLREESISSTQAELKIYFMGIRPVWSCGQNESGAVIHEYQSLSIPPFSKIKNHIKKTLNATPSGRIFLNNSVRSGFSFQDGKPYILRDMGISRNLFLPPPKNPDYDLLYCGSLGQRSGLVAQLRRLADMGLKILVVGSVPDNIMKELAGRERIHLAGKLSRKELPQAFSRVRAGLNYTPDIYPFNLQTSTKTLEYCAAGLGLVSNKYQWAYDFCNKQKLQPLWLHDINNESDFHNFKFQKIDLSHLEWSRVLENSNFLEFVETTAASIY